MDAPTLVRVRFLTSRGSLCGVHVGGLEYDVPRPFAREVVEQEHVAEYVQAAPVPHVSPGADVLVKRKR